MINPYEIELDIRNKQILNIVKSNVEEMRP